MASLYGLRYLEIKSNIFCLFFFIHLQINYNKNVNICLRFYFGRMEFFSHLEPNPGFNIFYVKPSFSFICKENLEESWEVSLKKKQKKLVLMMAACLPTLSAKCLMPSTFPGLRRSWRNSAHASRTRFSWRKEAPSIRFCTLFVEMTTLPE